MSQTPEDYNKIEAFHHTSASNNPEDIIQNCHVALTAISNEFVKMLSNNKLLKQQLSERDATIAELKERCIKWAAIFDEDSKTKAAQQKRISELETALDKNSGWDGRTVMKVMEIVESHRNKSIDEMKDRILRLIAKARFNS